MDGQALGDVSMRQILADLTVFFEVSLDISSVYGVNLPFDARRSFEQRWGDQTQIITFVQTEPDGGLYLLREGSRIKPPSFAVTPYAGERADGGIRVMPSRVFIQFVGAPKGWPLGKGRTCVGRFF